MNYNIPLELVDIEGEGYHLTLNVSVNGKLARMVLDTGASRTVFDLNCLKGFETEQEVKEEDRLSTGVGSNTLKSYSIIFAEFKIGELRITDYPVAAIDLQHISSSYSSIGKGDVHGVIGGDLLFDYKALIDYQNLSLVLRS